MSAAIMLTRCAGTGSYSVEKMPPHEKGEEPNPYDQATLVNFSPGTLHTGQVSGAPFSTVLPHTGQR